MAAFFATLVFVMLPERGRNLEETFSK